MSLKLYVEGSEPPSTTPEPVSTLLEASVLFETLDLGVVRLDELRAMLRDALEVVAAAINEHGCRALVLVSTDKEE